MKGVGGAKLVAAQIRAETRAGAHASPVGVGSVARLRMKPRASALGAKNDFRRSGSRSRSLRGAGRRKSAGAPEQAGGRVCAAAAAAAAAAAILGRVVCFRAESLG